MSVIQRIVERVMWASCLCFALMLYRVPIRALPLQQGEAIELNQMVWITRLAQHLGTEVSSMIEYQSHYVLTRSLEQSCWASQCPQEQIQPQDLTIIRPQPEAESEVMISN